MQSDCFQQEREKRGKGAKLIGTKFDMLESPSIFILHCLLLPLLSLLSPFFFPTEYVQAVFRLSQPLSVYVMLPRQGSIVLLPHSLALTVFLHPLLRCSFHLGGGIIDVLIRTGHSTVTYSQHFGQMMALEVQSSMINLPATSVTSLISRVDLAHLAGQTDFPFFSNHSMCSPYRVVCMPCLRGQLFIHKVYMSTFTLLLGPKKKIPQDFSFTSKHETLFVGCLVHV